MAGIDRRGLLGAAGTAALGAAGAAQASAWGLFGWGHTRYPKPPQPVVRTKAGAVRGFRQGEALAFKGVPYGASTAGANRFRPPQKPQAWTDVRDAAESGPICPQPSFPVLPEEDGSQAHEPQGEDCLLVNVWTPAIDPRARLPVMVWFHGGGYTVGGGSAPWYDGANLAARHEVVVVTVNHRLNVVGFLDLSQIAGPDFALSGNAGMLDCVAALEWVRDNISGFGGDPGNVTIFGESGGAGKVSTLMAMPAAKGLFHRAIAESGAALKHATPEQSAKAARGLLDALGVGPSDIHKLQSMPIEDIIKALGQARLGVGFGPVVDGVAIPRNPFDPTAPDISADVPFLTGSNLTEATFLPDTPLEPMDEAGLLDRVKQYVKTDDDGARTLVSVFRDENPGRDEVFIFQLIASEYWMRAQVLLQAERKAAQNAAPVYVYQFDKLSPARGGKLHSPHGSEIPFVFDNLATAPELVGSGPEVETLAEQMSTAWVAFARHGHPGIEQLPRWPAYEPGQRQVMVFDTVSRLKSDPGGKGRAAIAALKASQAQA